MWPRRRDRGVLRRSGQGSPPEIRMALRRGTAPRRACQAGAGRARRSVTGRRPVPRAPTAMPRRRCCDVECFSPSAVPVAVTMSRRRGVRDDRRTTTSHRSRDAVGPPHNCHQCLRRPRADHLTVPRVMSTGDGGDVMVEPDDREAPAQEVCIGSWITWRDRGSLRSSGVSRETNASSEARVFHVKPSHG